MKDFYKSISILEVSDELMKIYQSNFVRKNLHINKSFTLELTKKWFREKEFKIFEVPFVNTKDLMLYKKDRNINYLHQNIKRILPHDIPIIYENEISNYGQFTPIYLDININTPIFIEYRLSNPNEPFIYMHEIIHTLVEYNNNNIDNFIDYELIPNMFEMLLASDLSEDVTKILINNKLLSLNNYIIMLKNSDNLDKAYASSYINSILKAIEFSKIYNKSNPYIKSEIIKKLEIILNEDIPIHILFDSYDISFEKNLCKALKRKELW